MTLGEPAPDFKDPHSNLSLSGLRGSWVVLFFYPKDSSPGCSVEAQKFQQMLPDLETLGAVVIGVSTDSTSSHEKFANGCSLTFALVSDTNKSISKAYGVMGGLTGLFGVADRQTFLINPEGRIAKHWRRVNPFAHALEVKHELETQQRANV